MKQSAFVVKQNIFVVKQIQDYGFLQGRML